MNFNSEERKAYESPLKWLMIEGNTLKKYEAKGCDEGLEKGREEGREEGQKKPFIKLSETLSNWD